MTEFSGSLGLVLIQGLISSGFVVCFGITIFGDEP